MSQRHTGERAKQTQQYRMRHVNYPRGEVDLRYNGDQNADCFTQMNSNLLTLLLDHKTGADHCFSLGEYIMNSSSREKTSTLKQKMQVRRKRNKLYKKHLNVNPLVQNEPSESSIPTPPKTKSAIAIISLLISFLAMAAAFLSIAVSWYTHLDNIAITKEIDDQDKQLNLLNEQKNICFKTNDDYWDYLHDLLAQQIIIRFGLTEPVNTIVSAINTKQSGLALEEINKLGTPYISDGEFLLLKCCMMHLNHAYSPDVYLILQQALDNGLNTNEYCIALGLIYYDIGDVVTSTKYLKDAQQLYNRDSPFYCVINYWLARISIEVRSCLCDQFTFLNSTFEDNSYCRVMKSSIAYIFNCEEFFYSGLSRFMHMICKYDDEGNVVDMNVSNHVLRFSNPARFLLSEGEDIDGIIAESLLYKKYMMLHNYTLSVYGDWKYEIYPAESLNEQGLALVDIVNDQISDDSYSLATLLDPRRIINPNIICDDFMNDCAIFSSFDDLVPFDLLLDYSIELSKLRTMRDDKGYAEALYDYVEKLERDDCYDELFKLKYAEYLDQYSVEQAGYDAIQAYDAGYRYKFIYTALQKYYEARKMPKEIQFLQAEMKVLGFSILE